MDVRTGEVMTYEEAQRRMEREPENAHFLKACPPQPITKKTGRNTICPCGSGIKFKKCCLHKG